MFSGLCRIPSTAWPARTHAAWNVGWVSGIGSIACESRVNAPRRLPTKRFRFVRWTRSLSGVEDGEFDSQSSVMLAIAPSTRR